MRAVLVATLLLATLAPLPSAQAAGFLEDSSGDVTARFFGAGIPAPPPFGTQVADLLALDVNEDVEGLSFTVHVTSLKETVTFAQYRIWFTWAKTEYVAFVQWRATDAIGDAASDAYLFITDDRWDRVADLDHTMDLGKNTVTVTVPKAYILSEKGRYPTQGDALEDVYVEAESHATFFQFSAEAYDRMPDGDATKPYVMQYGDVVTGHLRLDADDRVRVSNGGATTFVYMTSISNKADFDDEVTLTFADMPAEWQGTVQSPIRVPAGGARNIAVLVSVPFAHDHGGFSSFNLTATSERVPSALSSIRMGVLHTPIPQPAGHHAELYLHAEGFAGGVLSRVLPFASGYMNTDANHDNDMAEASPNTGRLGWHIPLAPELRMGLDFDLDRVGEISGAIVGHSKIEGTLTANLWLVGSNEDANGLLLADSETIDLALDITAPSPFKLTLTPTEDSDYIPYTKGQNMVLELDYETADGLTGICCIPGASPGLVVGDFVMKLPLNEYHDRLTGLSDAVSEIELRADGPVQKIGLPGSTMTYLFDLINNGADMQVIDLDLAGTDADLGTIVPDEPITLGAKETRRITLAVVIPPGRNDGEELEVLLFAHAQADPSKSAIARTKTVVAKAGASEASADETNVLLAARDAERNDAPGPSAMLALAGLAAVALALRRKK